MGFYLSVETPEGHSVGVVKNLSYLTNISLPSYSESIYAYVNSSIIRVDEATSPNDLYDKVKVIINGNWYGVCENAIELYKDLKTKKEQGIINIYTSISFKYS